MVFQKKTLGKSFFIFKLTGRAMVRPAISDKSKAPLDEQGVALSKKNVKGCLPKVQAGNQDFFSPAGDLKI